LKIFFAIQTKFFFGMDRIYQQKRSVIYFTYFLKKRTFLKKTKRLKKFQFCLFVQICTNNIFLGQTAQNQTKQR